MFEQLGGKPTPAVGWGMGIERMLLLLEAAGVPMPAEPLDVYAIVPGPEALPVAMATCEALRAAGVSVHMHAAGAEGQGSMKSQFRRADASGARHAVIFGPDELGRGQAALKDLRNPTAPQTAIALDPVDALVSHIRSASTRTS
jgi:histidyl-tRNA synthetase